MTGSILSVGPKRNARRKVCVSCLDRGYGDIIDFAIDNH